MIKWLNLPIIVQQGFTELTSDASFVTALAGITARRVAVENATHGLLALAALAADVAERLPRTSMVVCTAIDAGFDASPTTRFYCPVHPRIL
jgi:hypothetical protein